MTHRSTWFSILATVAVSTWTGCGTPCSHIAGAEEVANSKGTGCGVSSTRWDNARVTRCESNLSKCSADDQKWLGTYADCLQNLPTCAEGQSFSWSLSRVGCAESLLKLSSPCAKGIQ